MKRRRRAPSQSYRDGKRGRHKRASSPEARVWLAEHAPPEQPAWMPAATYTALMGLRSELEGGKP